jgi:malate dehydrogenase (oxaloacetate-decarboxylating)(NADP+)
MKNGITTGSNVSQMSPNERATRERAIFHDPEAVLRLHRLPPHGKTSQRPTKPCQTREDLSLSYSPGVAIPCLRIQENPDDVWEYTARGNVVAVISNGTAVLGLGDIGAAAAKPVMEGKAVLFKRFAGIDAIDLEVDTHDPQAFIAAIRLLEPSFGGINLEDIKAPECFQIETALQERMDIPVFHDDQHGTAVVAGAALLNALQVTGRAIENVNVVFCGAGAAGLACAHLFLELGIQPDRLMMVDRCGVVYIGRSEEMDPWKSRFARSTSRRTLTEALDGADLFVGVSAGGILRGEMIAGMRKAPILFALANPIPEIDPALVKKIHPDAIVATGRSDVPNQINNLLGFPFLFRGALDVRSKRISTGMKLSAVHALAGLARTSEGRPPGMPSFGPQALLPNPFDQRLLPVVASAVAQKAQEEGIARLSLPDMNQYRETLTLLARDLATT